MWYAVCRILGRSTECEDSGENFFATLPADAPTSNRRPPFHEGLLTPSDDDYKKKSVGTFSSPVESEFDVATDDVGMSAPIEDEEVELFGSFSSPISIEDEDVELFGSLSSPPLPPANTEHIPSTNDEAHDSESDDGSDGRYVPIPRPQAPLLTMEPQCWDVDMLCGLYPLHLFPEDPGLVFQSQEWPIHKVFGERPDHWVQITTWPAGVFVAPPSDAIFYSTATAVQQACLKKCNLPSIPRLYVLGKDTSSVRSW